MQHQEMVTYPEETTNGRRTSGLIAMKNSGNNSWRHDSGRKKGENKNIAIYYKYFIGWQ